jgi:hypothetical protein
MSASVWNQSNVTLNTSFPDAVPRDSVEAFDAYQEKRYLDGTLETGAYWQYNQCLKDGYQATDDSGTVACRGEVPNIGCYSYDPARAGYERQQQILAAVMERELDIPDSVSTLFGDGMDLNDAYAKEGLPVPCGDAPAPKSFVRAADPSATLVRGGIGAGAKRGGMRLASSGAGQTAAYGMSAAAAYKNGRIVSTFERGAPNAYTLGPKAHPAEMPPPGTPFPSHKGAQMYGRMLQAGEGPSTRSTMPTHGALGKDLYKQPQAAGRLDTDYCQ